MTVPGPKWKSWLNEFEEENRKLKTSTSGGGKLVNKKNYVHSSFGRRGRSLGFSRYKFVDALDGSIRRHRVVPITDRDGSAASDILAFAERQLLAINGH